MKISRSVLEDAAYEADLDPEVDLRLDYSGRFMYGEKCVGVVGTAGDLVAFALRLYEADDDVSIEDLRRVREDSMGLSGIYYWPHIEAGDDE